MKEINSSICAQIEIARKAAEYLYFSPLSFHQSRWPGQTMAPGVYRPMSVGAVRPPDYR